MRRAAAGCACGLFGALLLGCSDEALKSVEENDPPPSDCSTREGADDWRCKGIALTARTQIDLLFVIDDGPASAGVQARFVAALGSFAEQVAAIDPQPELRIGFVRTSVGNPVCSIDSADRGLALASCRARPDAFVSEGVDAFETLCAAQCELPAVATSTGRPWIDLVEGDSDLLEGASLADALRCAAPMGISGCEHPAPLAAVELVEARSLDPDDPAFGFHRGSSGTMVVIVSAGHECSMGLDGASAFDPDGERTWWPDPAAASPSIGMCWAAGVECSAPSPGGSMQCDPADFDAAGERVEEEPAVLVPIEDVDNVWADRGMARIWPTKAALFVLGGVPAGFQHGDEVPYVAPQDEATALAYGVQPTCDVDGTPALPPVRLRYLAEQIERDSYWDTRLLSACDTDYGPALGEIAEAIEDRVFPVCMPSCVADDDPELPGLQPDCAIEADVPVDGMVESFFVARCEEGDVIPAGEPGCWSPRTGDQMHAECIEEGWNLEVHFEWNGPMPLGASFGSRCAWSKNKAIDCPDL